MDRELRKRFQFFLEHAGYSVPPGRAACALKLARVEERLEDALHNEEATVQWMTDDVPYDASDGYTEEQVAQRFDSGEWTGPYGCIVAIGDDQYPRATASLWGIVLGSQDLSDPYARVVAAELAYEAFYDLARETDERDRAARQDIATVSA